MGSSQERAVELDALVPALERHAVFADRDDASTLAVAHVHIVGVALDHNPVAAGEPAAR